MPRLFATRRNLNNLLINGDFEFAPTFVAPTTTTNRFINGQAAGGSNGSVDSQYGWSMGFSGTASAQYDSTQQNTGSNSLKASTLAVASYIEIFLRNINNSAVGGYNTATILAVQPSTAYKVTYWMKTNVVSGDSNDGAFIAVIENQIDGTSAGAQTSGTKVKVTQGWTQYTLNFTTSANTRYLQINPRVYGHTGAATLIMDAWFDDIEVGLATPVQRTAA